MLDVLTLTKELIAYQSITPHDANCQSVLKKHLQAMGFTITDLPAGPVANFWAEIGSQGPGFAFAGHTDVVSIGDRAQWLFDPFTATEHEGYLYGRGAQDMKGALAAMLVATQQFLCDHPKHKGRIGFLITSGEEGEDYLQGTPKVLDYLKQQRMGFDYCVVGEPSSTTQLGDRLRHGRRGSMHGNLTIRGKQGHVAYHHLADNPIHTALPVLHALVQTQWDQGSDDFLPTSLQISHIISGEPGSRNVIPGDLHVHFNLRFSPMISDLQIQQRATQLFEDSGLDYALSWELSGQPFITEQGELLQATEQAVQSVMGFSPELCTGGGTSDARFIAPTGAQVIELGVCNDTIHQINERVKIVELEQLVKVYYQVLKNLLG